MRSRLLVAAALGLVLAGNDLASPAWTAAATGNTGARTSVLAPPTGVSAARQPTGVGLSWTPSTSAWADGYRVLRSATAAGPLTEVAAVGAAASGWVDTTAHAGTWHYVVAAAAQSWSAGAARTSSADRVYYLRATSSFSDAQCPAAGTTADLLQGHVAPAGTGTGVALSTLTLCTDRFSAGQVLPAGTTTVNAYVVNTNSKSCTVDITLRRGGTVLGTGTGTIPGSSALHTAPWSFATAGATFADGDRLTLSLVARGNSGTNNCGSTTLRGDGSLAPSNLTLAG